MEKVIKYKSIDGCIFDDEASCLKHESFVAHVTLIMRELVKNPGTTEFFNGRGYIQQEGRIVEKAKRELLALGREIYKEPNMSFGWMGRYCDGNRPLYGAWCKLSNIDILNREWGQQYYANNPTKGELIKLNQ
jgi:hypothetical protein